MDAQLTPPSRIQPVSSVPIPKTVVQTQVEEFLVAFQNRQIAAKGGDTAVRAQLVKLGEALKSEGEGKM
ncbi:hypothetical protein JAAARDRAFT_528599 [Jaapia argillacea MUCL 33604]|uniref:Uncharacterized protein n=1 Tax=Jaapia argillacea MUCL 33604 TaxID=933084 RepID=A0A067Q754_9AGAM|nr:hypothetical protein JAAARDRAFT_528599 [Jaapia argillacea MUCL 33604]